MNPSKYLGNELKYIEKVLNSESWSATGGNWNNALEKAFCEKLGVKYAIAMNSGTATLHSALVAMGVGPGDEVISPALTVIMDSTATIHAGATPVYADVNYWTLNIDHEKIEKAITEKTKAIIAVGLYGLPPDMNAIMKIAKKHNLVVIEDNAQCISGEWKGRLAGTMGDMASFSFENSKHLSCGEGGILVTNNEKYAEKARKMAGHGYKHLRADEGRVRLREDDFQRPDYKRIDTVGWNYRLNEFSAAIALAQLERLDELVEMRVKSASLFKEVMEECDYLKPQYVPSECKHSYYTLGVRYEGEESIGVSWLEFRKSYISNGGDGIYGACALPYQEPVFEGKLFGNCLIAEIVQPMLMQFKTNYRDMKLVERKARALEKTIEDYRYGFKRTYRYGDHAISQISGA